MLDKLTVKDLLGVIDSLELRGIPRSAAFLRAWDGVIMREASAFIYYCPRRTNKGASGHREMAFAQPIRLLSLRWTGNREGCELLCFGVRDFTTRARTGRGHAKPLLRSSMPCP